MKFNSMYILVLATGILAAPRPQVPDGGSYFEAKLVGDGSPRQAYLYEMTTTTVDCESEGACSTGSTTTKTTDITWTANVDGIPWINGGFSVSESKSVGETSTCNQKKGTKHVCIWTRIAHTGYESQKWLIATNGMSQSTKVGDAEYIWSPNSNAGHANVCAYDDECTEWGKGDQWWGYMSKGDALWEAVSNKGGPQAYVWGDERWN